MLLIPLVLVVRGGCKVNGPAAKELMGVVMLDDYVARMAALRRWDAKWLVTLDLAVDFNPPLNLMPEEERMKALRIGVEQMTRSVLHALRDDSQHVTKFDYTDNMILMKVCFIRMEPKE